MMGTRISQNLRYSMEGKVFTVTITDGSWKEEFSIQQRVLELSENGGFGWSYLANLLSEEYSKYKEKNGG